MENTAIWQQIGSNVICFHFVDEKIHRLCGTRARAITSRQRWRHARHCPICLWNLKSLRIWPIYAVPSAYSTQRCGVISFEKWDARDRLKHLLDETLRSQLSMIIIKSHFILVFPSSSIFTIPTSNECYSKFAEAQIFVIYCRVLIISHEVPLPMSGRSIKKNEWKNGSVAYLPRLPFINWVLVRCHHL